MNQERDEQPKEASSSPGNVGGNDINKKIEDLRQVVYGHKERKYPGLQADVERHESEIKDLKKGMLSKILARINLIAFVTVSYILFQFVRDIIQMITRLFS